jgi:hypothetical protein
MLAAIHVARGEVHPLARRLPPAGPPPHGAGIGVHVLRLGSHGEQCADPRTILPLLGFALVPPRGWRGQPLVVFPSRRFAFAPPPLSCRQPDGEAKPGDNVCDNARHEVGGLRVEEREEPVVIAGIHTLAITEARLVTPLRQEMLCEHLAIAERPEHIGPPGNRGQHCRRDGIPSRAIRCGSCRHRRTSCRPPETPRRGRGVRPPRPYRLVSRPSRRERSTGTGGPSGVYRGGTRQDWSHARTSATRVLRRWPTRYVGKIPASATRCTVRTPRPRARAPPGRARRACPSAPPPSRRQP